MHGQQNKKNRDSSVCRPPCHLVIPPVKLSCLQELEPNFKLSKVNRQDMHSKFLQNKPTPHPSTISRHVSWLLYFVTDNECSQFLTRNRKLTAWFLHA